MDLTQTAIEGYEAARASINAIEESCPYITTSPAEMAWNVGRWMAMTGRSKPRDCRTSRGATMHINDMKVELRYVTGARFGGPVITRIA